MIEGSEHTVAATMVAGRVIKSMSFYSQKRDLVEIKEERPEYKDIASHVFQDVLNRLDKAFAAFFRRVAQRQDPGYPRFKGRNRYDSFTYPDASGWKFDGWYLHLSKIGSIKVKLHRTIEGKIKTVTIKRECDHWYVIFSCEVQQPVPLPLSYEDVGIDLGVTHLATLSNGEMIEHPRYYRRAEKQLAKRQQAVSRKKHGSHRRRRAGKLVGKAYRRIARQRRDFLHKQGLEPHRATYLEKQILALETVCRKLSGETFSLEEEVQRCFDIHPAWIPESRFEQGLALFDEVLPGDGSLSDRLQAHRKRYQLAREKSGLLLHCMQRAAEEARRRTQTFVTLPADEGVELQTVSDQVFIGENRYLGNYRSRVALNTDVPIDLRDFMDFMCHEGYPGHHTEFVLKEQHLFRERGYIEQAISPIIGPQAVISEGIATWACEMIFPPGEAEQWLTEHMYPEAGIEPDPIDLAKLHKAGELLYAIGGNAAFLLHEGRSDEEVKHYLRKYSMMLDEEALKFLAFLKDPFQEAYIFTYFYGKQLMKPWLQGPDRLVVFRRFLTEQVYPSELVKEIV